MPTPNIAAPWPAYTASSLLRPTAVRWARRTTAAATTMTTSVARAHTGDRLTAGVSDGSGSSNESSNESSNDVGERVVVIDATA